VLLLYDTWGDTDIAVECMISLIPLFASNTKLINIVVNNDKVSCQIHIDNVYFVFSAIIFFYIVTQFRRLLQLMNKHWEFFNSEYERHILRYYASIGQKMTSYFAGRYKNN